MDSVKNLFTTGITIGVFFTAAIVYVFWAIASFQWWLLIVAAFWAVGGFLWIRTAKLDFETVQEEFDLTRVEGSIEAYEDVLNKQVAAKLAREAEKA